MSTTTSDWTLLTGLLATTLFYFTVYIAVNSTFIITVKSEAEVKMTTILKAMAVGAAYMGLV